MMSVAMEQPGMRVADLRDEVAVILLGVAAAHVLQHFVIARLDGDLDVRHDLGQRGHGVHQIVGEVVGMRGEEADALDALDLVDEAQEPGEVGSSGRSLP